MLIGREAETAGLGQLLEAARSGTSGALVLRGEAGIGKTALLEHAAATATGFQVLRATGIEYEAELPYAALHQLLRPLEDRIDSLAEPQARALRGALGLAHERDADAFLVGVGVLTLLADAAEEQPLLAVLDDAGWFDRESAHALGFTARRLGAEGVVLLFAVRDEPSRQFELPGVDVLRVQRLADDDARQPARRRRPARRDEAVARAGGNPLALLELAAGHEGTEQAFAGRVQALPEGTQTLLLLAAADTTTSLSVIGAAGRRLGLDETALEPAETAGLVRATGGTLEFRHPLVRSAIYHAAPFAARARAHRTLADVLTGDQNADRRAWHHAAAVLGTDEEAAAELEGTAGRAIERSGHAAAAAALERAGELSPDESDRTRRLVAAAREAGMAGEQERALAILDRLGELTEPAFIAAAALMRGWAAIDLGARLEAFEILMQAVRAGREAAPGFALLAAVRATEVAGQARTPERLAELRTLLPTIPVSTDDERTSLAVAEGFSAFGADDFDVAFPMFKRATALAQPSNDALALLHASWAAGFDGDPVEATRLAARAEQLARARGLIAPLPAILMGRATWELGSSRFSAAESTAAEALTLARELGQAGVAAVMIALLARVDAVRGREEDCRRRAAEALALAASRIEAHPESAAETALAQLDLAMGRPADALSRLQAVFTSGHSIYRHAVIDDLVEAAASAGRPDEALDAVAAWQRWARHSGHPIGDVVLARARALLAGPEDAEARFQDALAAHERLPWPFLQARTELAYGEFLRRARRRTDARTQLRAALARFEALGAAPWADRAAAELRATGETARKRDASTLDTAHAAGAPDRPPGRRGRPQPRHRRAALPEPEDRRVPPAQDLPEARHRRPRRPDPAGLQRRGRAGARGGDVTLVGRDGETGGAGRACSTRRATAAAARCCCAARRGSARRRCSTTRQRPPRASGSCGRRGSSPRPSCRTRRCTSCCGRWRIGSTGWPTRRRGRCAARWGWPTSATSTASWSGSGTLTVLADAAEEQPVLALLDDAALVRPRVVRRARLRGAAPARGGRRPALRGAGRARRLVRAAGRRRAAGRATRRGGRAARARRRGRRDAARRGAGARRGQPAGAARARAARDERQRRRRGAGLRGPHRRAAGGHPDAAAAGCRGRDAVAGARRRRRPGARRSTRRHSSRPSSTGSSWSATAPSSSATRWCARPPTGPPRSRGGRARTWLSPTRSKATRTPTGARGIAPRRCSAPTSRPPAISSAPPTARCCAAATPPPRRRWRGPRSSPPARGSRSRRLAAAADAAWLAGDTDRALALVERVELRRTTACARTTRLRPRPRRGPARIVDGVVRVVPAARRAPRAPGLALQAVTRAAMAAWESGRTEKVGELRAAAAAIPATSAGRAVGGGVRRGLDGVRRARLRPGDAGVRARRGGGVRLVGRGHVADGELRGRLPGADSTRASRWRGVPSGSHGPRERSPCSDRY